MRTMPADQAVGSLEVKALRRPSVTDPIGQLLVPLVRWVRGRPDQLGVSRNTSTILRWTCPRAFQATRRLELAGRDLLHEDVVLPAVAEIVEVREASLGAPDAIERVQLPGLDVLCVQIRRPDLFTADLERMQMGIFPPHRVLEHVMKLLEIEISGDDETPPDRWTGPLQSDLELVDGRHGQTIWR